ncbi:MAG: DegV family protein [Lactobacillaceae bacterium]|jgi:DegV family protein with EDD domain|nr:DegV family protein [Lactobacillaceae bacterium]
MTQIKIVTDSTALLTAAEVADLDINIVPLSVMIDDHSYQDTVTISRDEFVEKMATAKTLPKTSTPAIGTFTDVYERLLAESPETQIISIHLTVGLSGTFDAARQAAAIVDDKRITVIDSTFIDRSLAFQVLQAAKMAQAGDYSVAQIVNAIKATAAKTHLYLTVASLDNLVAGGRISRATGFIGGLLQIKIGAHVVAGEILVESKGRGGKATKAYLQHIIEQMQAAPNGIAMIGIAHVAIPKEAAAFEAQLQSIFPDAQILVGQTSPTVSTHTGVGAFGISYLEN